MATSIDPKSLRVVDLKEELGKRNLAKTGKKDELVARLTEALSAEAAEVSKPTTETETEAAAAAPPPSTTTTTTTEDVSIPSTIQETKPLTEQTIVAPTTQHELPTAIEQQAQVNDVVESQPLDTTSTPTETTRSTIEETITKTTPAPAPEVGNSKTSEDSTTVAASVSSSTAIPSSLKNDQSPFTSTSKAVPAPYMDTKTDDQETTLKRKREEPVQAQEDKRTKMETKEPSSPSATVEETGDRNAVCIKGFVRPLITKHLQEFIKQYGDVKRFWIDPIKTHCYIIYDTVDQAVNAFKNINGTVYPPTNTGKQVIALRLTSTQAAQLMDREQQVADNHGRVNWEKLLEKVLNNETIDEPTPTEHSPTAAKRRLGGLEQITRQLQQRGAVSAIMDQEKQPPHSILDRLSTSDTTRLATAATTSQVTIAGVAASMNKEGKSLDDLFLKTKANPPLYYLPVDKDVAASRLEAMKRKVD